MRIIGNIEHPNLKITVFKMDNRISEKFENASYEQTFEFGMDERLTGPDSVKRWADSLLLEQVLDMLRQMHGNAMAALARAFPVESEEEFEIII